MNSYFSYQTNLIARLSESQCMINDLQETLKKKEEEIDVLKKMCKEKDGIIRKQKESLTKCYSDSGCGMFGFEFVINKFKNALSKNVNLIV